MNSAFSVHYQFVVSKTSSSPFNVIEAHSPFSLFMVTLAGNSMIPAPFHQNPSISPKIISSPLIDMLVTLFLWFSGWNACQYLLDPPFILSFIGPLLKFKGHSMNSHVPSYLLGPSFPETSSQ